MAKHRSPAHPYLTLSAALDVIATVYANEKRHSVPVGIIAKHGGYESYSSSSAKRLVASLNHYGLVEEEGAGIDRKMKLSERALDIVLAEGNDSPSRLTAIKEAAKSPTLHKKIFDQFPDELPSNATLRNYLIRDLDFNDSLADTFINKLRKTVDTAGLYSNNEIDHDAEFEETSVRDLTESNFPPPRKQQVLHADQVLDPQQVRREVFTLEEGDVMVQWPATLSKESYQDLEDHLELILRKVKRSVVSPPQHQSDIVANLG